MIGRGSKFALCAMLAFSAAGCSDSESALEASRSGGTQAGGAQEFSREEKLAARALSIGDSRSIESSGGDYEQALLCSMAIGLIGDRFETAGGLSDLHMQGVAQARGIYDQRAHALASGQGKSAEEISSDREQIAADNPDSSANARVAIACLRNLAEPA